MTWHKIYCGGWIVINLISYNGDNNQDCIRAKGARNPWGLMSSLSVIQTKYFFSNKMVIWCSNITNSTHNKDNQKGHTDTVLNDDKTRAVKLPLISPQAPLTVNGAPRNIQGSLAALKNTKAFALITYSNIHGNYIWKQYYNIPHKILYFKSFRKVYSLSLISIAQLITLFQITAPLYGRLDLLNSLRTSGIWKWSHCLVLWVWISLFKRNIEANTWRVFLLCTGLIKSNRPLYVSVSHKHGIRLSDSQMYCPCHKCFAYGISNPYYVTYGHNEHVN